MKTIEEHWQVYLRQKQPIIREEDYHRRREAFFAGAVCLMNLITQVAEIHADVDDLGNNPRLNALLAELEEFTKTLEKT